MEERVQDFIIQFTSILWEAFPFIVLGALVAGILEEMVPQNAIAKIVPKSRFLAILLGGCLGLIFPMCECGIVPIMRRLLRKGLPLGTCVAYLLAGPIINVVVILSTWVAFEQHTIAVQMVGIRVGMAFIIACTTAAVVEYWLYPKYGYEQLLTETAMPQKAKTISLGMVSEAGTTESVARKPLLKRLTNIADTALHDFVDIMIFLTLGALLAAGAKQMFTQDDVEQLSNSYPAVAILSLMALAIILCLCSEADAFVAASFTKLHASAKLSFLVLGPMCDIKLMLLYTRVFKRKLILTIVPLVIVQVFIYSMITHYAWNALGWPNYANDSAAIATESTTPAPNAQ